MKEKRIDISQKELDEVLKEAIIKEWMRRLRTGYCLRIAGRVFDEQ